MNCISIDKPIKYHLSFAPNYVFTKDNECFNTCTNRNIKQVLNNGCIGYNINGKFYSLTRLRNHLIKPKKEKLPF